MPTHRIKADLDVDGEVQGTSLDINGVADITSAAGSADMITLHNTTNGSGCSIKFTDQNSGAQTGTLDFHHSNNAFSQDGGAIFQFLSTEDDLVLSVGTADSTHGRMTVWGGANNSKPDYAFGQDLDTGMLRTGTNALRLVTGGTAALSIDSSQNATFAGAVSLTGGSLSITADGSNATVMAESGSGDFEINTVADIILDAGGGDIQLRDDGTTFGTFSNSSSDFWIGSGVQDKDIIFRGNDNGSYISALTLDMSAAGYATFNSGVEANTSLKVNAPDGGSAPAMTAIIDMHGYEQRGVGIKMRDNVNSASGSTNAEWFVGTGYSQTGFNIGYASDGSQSSYAAQNKFSITTAGNATFAGNVTAGSNSLTAGSLDINGNADISGNLTGLDNVTSTNFIIGGHTINDIDVTSEDSNADDHLMTAKAIVNLIADNENSFLTSSGNTSGTAAIATTITVADESSDTSCNVLFTTAATGNLGPKSGTNLTFNSSSGVLTATGFAGALTGNVTGNASGSSGSCTGNAATATEATNITATANNSANETVYLTFVDGATGTQGIETDTGLSYNPSTGNLTTNILNVGGGLTHDGDINNKISFGTDTQTFSCDGNDALIIRGNAVTDQPLFEITGAGAGNQLNIGLLLKGNVNGNPIKMKMQAPPAGGGSVTGAGILSYEPDADTFNIGQSTTHNSMAISINNDDHATMTNVVTLSGGFILDGNTITGVNDSGEFDDDDAHIMTSAGVQDKILGYGYTTNTGDATLAGTQTFSGAKTFSAAVTVSNSTASSSKTTGAVKVTGGVGIQGALNVGGDVTAFASSDERYKDNLQAITNPIDKVKSLTGYTFTWNDKHEQFNGNNDIGVVAQEVEKVLPEIVDTRDNGYKAVKYEKMVALLIEAVKDQQKQIDELKEKCNGCSG